MNSIILINVDFGTINNGNYDYQIQAAILEGTHERDRSILIPEQYFLLQIYSASSCFHRSHYRKAERIYNIALIARKAVGKTRTPLSRSFENLVEMYPEYEIRYKIAQCLEFLHERSAALTALTNIPNRQRTLKINMMIGQLSMQLGKCSTAETAFRAVIRTAPLNLDALKGLMSLGFSDIHITSNQQECKNQI